MAAANSHDKGCSLNRNEEVEGSLGELLSVLNNFPQLISDDFDEDDVALPLHSAVESNQLDICRILVESGCDVNKQSKEDSKSPLHLATETKVSAEIMNLLITAGANIEAKDDINCTALNLLFMEPGRPESEFQFEKFKMLINFGASVNTSAAYGSQPLHGSVCVYHAGEVEEAHDHSPTPLCVQVTKMLLDKGADVNCIENSLQTPLHFATGTCCPSTVQLLLEYGAEVECRDNYGVSPLENIARHTTPPVGEGYINKERFLVNRIKCLELLLSHGADVNNRNAMGETALHWLVSRPSITTVKMLEAFLLQGANPNAQTTRLQTPLHYICIACEDRIDTERATEDVLGELIDILTSHGANMESKDINGHTPLVLSIRRDDSKLVSVFLKKGARKDCEDKFGMTLYHALEVEGIKGSIKSLFADDIKYKDIRESFGTMVCDYQDDEKFQPLEEELLPMQTVDGIYDVILDNYLGAVEDMNCMDQDEALTRQLFLHVLKKESQSNDQLEMSHHIQSLKDCIKDIDEFCNRKLSTTGIGQVQINKELASIQKEVDLLVNRIANAVKEQDERMEFTPVLSGSMSEGTKIGTLNEFDYLLYMTSVSNMCDVKDSDVPGFVHISAKELPSEQINGIFRESDHALVANIFRAYLYQLIQKVLGSHDIWDSLHFYWDAGPIFTLRGPENISSLVIQWAGLENSGLKVSIDLAPVIHQKGWIPRDLREHSSLLRVPIRAFGSLIVISKEAPEHETFEEGHDRYLRLSYSHVEKEVMLSIPEHKRKAFILAKVLISEKVLPLLRPVESRIAPYSKIHISSYMLKMALFALLQNVEVASESKGSFQDIDSSMKGVRELTSMVFSYIEKCILCNNLPSYFLPKQNILRYHTRISGSDRIVCNVLSGLLQ